MKFDQLLAYPTGFHRRGLTYNPYWAHNEYTLCVGGVLPMNNLWKPVVVEGAPPTINGRAPRFENVWKFKLYPRAAWLDHVAFNRFGDRGPSHGLYVAYDPTGRFAIMGCGSVSRCTPLHCCLHFLQMIDGGEVVLTNFEASHAADFNKATGVHEDLQLHDVHVPMAEKMLFVTGLGVKQFAETYSHIWPKGRHGTTWKQTVTDL